MASGVRLRRIMAGSAGALAALLVSEAAHAGACDARKAQPLIGKSYSPALEERALKLSGASIAALIGLGIAGTADYRTDRVDLHLDDQGNVVGIGCG